MKISIEILSGHESGKVFSFDQPANLLVGRSKEALIQTGAQDKYVSRNHCILEIAPPKCILHHISKTNETKVNEIPVQEATIHHGDVIKVGFTSFKITIEDQVKSQHVTCKRCQSTFEIPDNHNNIDLCDNCIANELKADAASTIEKKYSCHICGKDLTEKANSDGKETMFCLQFSLKEEDHMGILF